jgi:hypothetical protein
MHQGNDAVLKETYVNLTTPAKTNTYFNIMMGGQILGHYKKTYSPPGEVSSFSTLTTAVAAAP